MLSFNSHIIVYEMSKLAIASKSTQWDSSKLTASLDTEAHHLTTTDRFACFFVILFSTDKKKKVLKFLPR